MARTRWIRWALTVAAALLAPSFGPFPVERGAGSDLRAPYTDLAQGDLMLDRVPLPEGGPVALLEDLLRDSGVLRPPWSLVPHEDRTSPLGTHHRFRFQAYGLELFGALASLHVDPAGRAWYATFTGRGPLPAAEPPVPALLSPAAAQAIARTHAPGEVAAAALGWRGAAESTVRAAWRLDLVGDESPGDVRLLLDAQSGALLGMQDRLVSWLDGTANVFPVSPMVSAQDYDLLDVPAGADVPYLNEHLVPVSLRGLSDAAGQRGRLVGQHSTVMGIANEPDLDFSYTRMRLEFQEVMVYYHTDALQRVVQQLGFDDVNNESQLTTTANEINPLPNAYYSPSQDATRFISHSWVLLNADAAEDGEVIVHENGHAFQHDQVPDWGNNSDQRSMGEGFSDFLGSAVLSFHSGGFGDPCTGEWFGSHLRGLATPLTGPPCVRYLDNDYTYSQIGGSGAHTAGQIWSGLLWDAWHEYDVLLALRLVLASHFLMDGSKDMRAAADTLILVDRELYAGAHSVFVAEDALRRGIDGPWARYVLGLGPEPPGGENRAPTAAFTSSIEGATVHLDASGSSDPEGGALAYAWSLGDGATANGAIVDHTYAASGTYPVTLLVTDPEGAADTESRDVRIAIPGPPTVDQWRFGGRIGCSVAWTPIQTRDLCPNDPDAVQVFDLSLDPFATRLRVDLVWSPSEALPAGLAAAETMGYSWIAPPGLAGASGPSPLVHEQEPDPGSPLYADGADARIEVRPSGQSGLVLGQPFVLCVVALYGGATLPDGYSCG